MLAFSPAKRGLYGSQTRFMREIIHYARRKTQVAASTQAHSKIDVEAL
jgi:hypothetical protein